MGEAERRTRNRRIAELAPTRIIIVSESCPVQLQHWVINPNFPVVAASRQPWAWVRWHEGMTTEQIRAQAHAHELNAIFTHLLGEWHPNLVAAVLDLRMRTAPDHVWHAESRSDSTNSDIPTK